MSSSDSYRMRPTEELTDHLVDIDQQCAAAEALLESLYGQRDIVLGVIAEAIGSRTVRLELETTAAMQ
jgi:uncharacterized UPF0146 family protein